MSLATDVRELQRLLDSLRHAGNRQYKTQLRYVHDALTKSPRFRAVFQVLAAETAGFEVDDWIQKRVLEARQTCHEWPEQENQKLRVLGRLLEVGAIQENLNPTAVGRQFEYSDSLDEDFIRFDRDQATNLRDTIDKFLAFEHHHGEPEPAEEVVAVVVEEQREDFTRAKRPRSRRKSERKSERRA